ncbi:ribonucleotide reductase alpha subunit [Cryptobacterium sp. CAG:338]|nr:ribonucleotide reductase alpha subunit [Cryptobacterium sp. CAG:338]
MNEESIFGGSSFQDQNAHSNSSQAYLQRAASAVEEGDIVLGIHLYLAAYERALRENRIPSEAVLEGMTKAWDLAIRAKQRSLAEYIFEKLEAFWTPEEMARHAQELQELAFDKLEEYGLDRSLVEDMADMVSQDLMDATDDVLYRYDGDVVDNTALPLKRSAKNGQLSSKAENDKLNEASVKGSVSSGAEQKAANQGSQSNPSDDPASVSKEKDIAALNSAALTSSSSEERNGGVHNEDNAGVDKGALEIESAVIPSDSPLAAAFAQLTNLATGAASKETQEAPQQRFNYRNLVGFDKAIASMAKLGVGRAKDPEFAQFLEMLNFRHGMPGMPGLGTLIFRSPAREDANCFMVATVGELGLPAVRMRLDRNAMGQVVLCVMASPNFKARLSGVSRSGFDSPTVVVLEDLDLWDLPFFDGSFDDVQSLLTIQLSRGAREALALVQAALTSPEATVLISASEPSEIDPFFWDLIGDHRFVDIDLPDEDERRKIWLSEQSQHPSMRGLNRGQLVDFSRGLSRFEIYAISNESVEEAYRESVAQNTFCAVETDKVLMRLSNFQPLESEEYKRMEDLAVDHFRKELANIDDLLEE